MSAAGALMSFYETPLVVTSSTKTLQRKVRKKGLNKFGVYFLPGKSKHRPLFSPIYPKPLGTEETKTILIVPYFFFFFCSEMYLCI